MVFPVNRRGAVVCAGLSISMLATAALGAVMTGATGGDQPFSTHQPTLGLNFVMHDRGSLGEIRIFPWTHIPSPWLLADGQQRPVLGNEALAAELGNAYGGNGTFFNLPSLVDRLPVGSGQGFGLTNRARGDQFGAESITLTEDQMPTHAHGLTGGSTTGDAGGGQAHSTVQQSLGLRFGINTDGSWPDRNDPDPAGGTPNLPFTGQIRLLAGTGTPLDVEAADGTQQNLAQNTALFALLGTTFGGNGQTTFGLPDLRGRTPIGKGQGPGLSDRVMGEQPGSETVTLDVGQMPGHTHTEPNGDTDPTGGSQPIDNMQPSLTINFLIRLQGFFPDFDGGFDAGAAYMGEIIMFGGNFAPAGWASCDGQLLTINQNQALFSLLGTTYGGDGVTTFALPDLRGRGLNGVGGVGRSLGEMLGTETMTLGVDNLPSHVHEVPAPAGAVALMLAGTGAAAGRRRR